MLQFKSLIEILKLLEKSNCRKCNEKTCMAFAAAVFQGDRPLSDCPKIPPDIAQMYSSQPNRRIDTELEIKQQLAELRDTLLKIDFADAAKRIAAAYDGTWLAFNIMGKDFAVNARGNIRTQIHVNPWMTIPIFNYILYCKGSPIKGKWAPLRELPSGKDWYRLFEQRCEKPMKKIADACPDLFADMLNVFNGRSVDNQCQSDLALVLHPLPLVPLLICYSRAEEDLESDLNLFFDASAEDNLGIDGIYSLGAGITRMFEKLALRHGCAPE